MASECAMVNKTLDEKIAEKYKEPYLHLSWTKLY